MLIDKIALASVGALGAEVTEGEGSALVDWQPGNGTRYMVMFTSISEAQAKAFGCSDRAVLVSLIWEDGKGRAWPFGAHGLAHITYVAEKFAMQYEGDNLAIAALINIALPQCDTAYGVECLNRACNRAA